MNKIKVIDILVKIANGEEVPMHIKIGEGKDLYYDYATKNYYDDIGCNELFNSWIADYLNEEAEIIEAEPIEEDKKIEKLDINDNGYLVESPSVVEIVNKINEIIDEINEGEDEW